MTGRMTVPLRSLACLTILLSTACAPLAASPAIRTIPLESAQTVRAEHVAVRASGGGHDQIFGPDVATGSGGISVGLAERAELQLDGAFGYVDGLDHSRALSPWAAAGRIGIKHQPVDWLALTGGMGAGSGPWGAFMGGDLGIIFAYENPYIVPFFAARMQLSMPVNGQTELLVTQSGDGTSTTTLLSPTTTFWFQPSTGVRIPICTDTACDGVRISLTAAFAWTVAVVVDQHNGEALGGEAGLQIEL
jgi:hypothetical protein